MASLTLSSTGGARRGSSHIGASASHAAGAQGSQRYSANPRASCHGMRRFWPVTACGRGVGSKGWPRQQQQPHLLGAMRGVPELELPGVRVGGAGPWGWGCGCGWGWGGMCGWGWVGGWVVVGGGGGRPAARGAGNPSAAQATVRWAAQDCKLCSCGSTCLAPVPSPAITAPRRKSPRASPQPAQRAEWRRGLTVHACCQSLQPAGNCLRRGAPPGPAARRRQHPATDRHTPLLHSNSLAASSLHNTVTAPPSHQVKQHQRAQRDADVHGRPGAAQQPQP